MSIAFDDPAGFENMVRGLPTNEHRIHRIAQDVAELCFEIDEANGHIPVGSDPSSIRAYYSHDDGFSPTLLWSHTAHLSYYANPPVMNEEFRKAILKLTRTGSHANGEEVPKESMEVMQELTAHWDYHMKRELEEGKGEHSAFPKPAVAQTVRRYLRLLQEFGHVVSLNGSVLVGDIDWSIPPEHIKPQLPRSKKKISAYSFARWWVSRKHGSDFEARTFARTYLKATWKPNSLDKELRDAHAGDTGGVVEQFEYLDDLWRKKAD